VTGVYWAVAVLAVAVLVALFGREAQVREEHRKRHRDEALAMLDAVFPRDPDGVWREP
jgi:hypothetical protein